MREPLRSLVGRYEAHLVVRRHKTIAAYDKALQRFFGFFPRKSRPDQFHITDVEDYRFARLADGAAASSVKMEIGVVSMFFNWLRRAEGLELDNPAAIKYQRRSKTTSLTTPASTIPSL